jgi:hypothetical protein
VNVCLDKCRGVSFSEVHTNDTHSYISLMCIGVAEFVHIHELALHIQRKFD